MTTHTYELAVEWTGNRGPGTTSYRGYDRTHAVRRAGKPELLGSSDPSFRGDPGRWNPEELLVASLSTCHMLFYLHEAAVSGVVVHAYTDEPLGEMVEYNDNGGRFRSVLLRPVVTIADPATTDTARQLHTIAHEKCFVANSVNFPVSHDDVILVQAL